MNKTYGNPVIAICINELIAERDELKFKNDSQHLLLVAALAEIERLKVSEQKYNDWLIWFQSAKVR